MENSQGTAQSVLAVVVLPPPMHGQALVTQAILDRLSATSVGLEIVNISPGSLQKSFKSHRKRIAAIVLKALPAILIGQSDILYSVAEAGLGICYNFLVVLAARSVQIRIVLHHHTASYAKVYHRRFDWLSRLAGKRTIHVALDESMARDLKAKYSAIERVVISHNATYVGRPRIADRCVRKLTCGFMSNLTREKGLDLFVEFVRVAKNSGLDLQAVIAGPAGSREVEAMIASARNEFGNMLTVLGPVADSSKDAFFRSIDVFLLPTRHKAEAQPLVVLEALSYGVPVVSSRQGYCAELVGGAGVSAEISEFQRVAMSFVNRCYNEQDYLSKMRVEARERFDNLRADADRQLSNLIEMLSSKAVLCSSP